MLINTPAEIIKNIFSVAYIIMKRNNIVYDEVHKFTALAGEITFRNILKSSQGLIFVSTGSGTPEVPKLPSAWGYNWATLPPGDINTGVHPSRLRVGRGADNPTL
jgi:hypothetical protein